MSEEVVISYMDTIEVIQSGQNNINITLTQQGVQGPAGPQGDITPEMTALRNETLGYKDAAGNHRDAANASQTAAASSAASAAASKTAAASSAAAAKTSETAAKASETAAKTSEVAAKTSETNSGVSETAAKASQTASKTSETNSKASEVAAAASQTASKTSETNAKASETASKLSEDASALSEVAAGVSEINAKTSETNSKTSETKAKTSETNAKASETASSLSEAESLISQNAAKTSETNSKASEVAAEISETNAAASERAANLSEIAAKASELAADTSAANAKSSENAAKSSENAAKASETAAQTFEADTATSAMNVQNDKTAVDAAKTAAETARNESQTAKSAAETAKTQAETARSLAQTARTDALAAVIDAEDARDAAEDYAAAAALSASQASQFDPSSYPMKQNNGSDFADPAQFRANIGAAAALETVEQVEAEAGVATVDRNWSAQRVRQAIAAYAPAKAHDHTVADITGLQASLDVKAPLVSPVLTGLPTVPTAAADNDTLQIANTAFVKRAIDALISGAPGALDTLQELATALGDDPNFATTVTSALADKSALGHTHTMAEITDLAAAIALLAPKASPALTGNPTATTQASTDNSTRLATTAHVKAVIAASGLATTEHTHVIDDITGLVSSLAGKSPTGHKHVAADITDLAILLTAKADLASPVLTGTPTAPTQAVGNNTTRIATTAFVNTAIANGISGKAEAGHTHTIADVASLQTNLDAKAPLASPSFTGTPTAPTQTAGNSSTRIATTAFVTAAISSFSTSLTIGGVTGLQAALDAKSPLGSPTFTGVPLAPTAAAATNTTQIATTAFVTKAVSDFGTALSIAGVTGLQAALDAKSPLGSPTFTGSPKAPTATAGTNTTQIATTAFVTAAISGFSTSLSIGGVSGLQGALDGKANSNNASFTGTANFTGALVTTGNISLTPTSGNASLEIGRTNGGASTPFIDFHSGATSVDHDSRIIASGGTGAIGGGMLTLTANAGVVCSGNISAYSDARLKTDVETITDALAKVMMLRGTSFTMNGERSIGVIAQEIRQVIPEVVREMDDRDKTLTVQYGNIVGVLIEAIKELKAEVDELKGRI